MIGGNQGYTQWNPMTIGSSNDIRYQGWNPIGPPGRVTDQDWLRHQEFIDQLTAQAQARAQTMAALSGALGGARWQGQMPQSTFNWNAFFQRFGQPPGAPPSDVWGRNLINQKANDAIAHFNTGLKNTVKEQTNGLAGRGFQSVASPWARGLQAALGAFGKFGGDKIRLGTEAQLAEANAAQGLKAYQAQTQALQGYGDIEAQNARTTQQLALQRQLEMNRHRRELALGRANILSRMAT